MGNISRAAATAALANVGVTEDGDNRGQWVETYQRSVGLPPGSPWCAAFIRYRFEQAAEKLDLDLPKAFPDSGWVPSYEGWAKRSGFWVPVKEADSTNVSVGDLVCFYFKAKDRCAHIGIVTSSITANGRFQSVEGNTGPDRGVEVERDGDGVYLKNRTKAMVGSKGGFIRIPF